MNRRSVATTRLAVLGMAACGLIGFGSAGGAAWAQTPQPSQIDPKHAPAEKIEPCPDRSAGSLGCGPTAGTDGALSRQLQQSHGTIRPPGAVDPGMVAPPPRGADQGMPVIPPPGTPGGNPHVVPQ